MTAVQYDTTGPHVQVTSLSSSAAEAAAAAQGSTAEIVPEHQLTLSGRTAAGDSRMKHKSKRKAPTADDDSAQLNAWLSSEVEKMLLKKST